MNDLSFTELQAVSRSDLHTFVHRAFAELNPQVDFHDNWHLELICAKLDAVRRGEIKRLIVMVPPRHLKSICASVALPAWILGHAPSRQIICVSYAQDLSEKLARDCRTLMLSKFYRSLFPRSQLDSGKQSVAEFTTRYNGYRLSTSVGGVLTGRGADIIIIDDPLKPDEALSDARRGSVNDWFDNSLYSRLNDKKNGAIVIIMQRLHQDDLVGHVLEKEGWEVIRLPAIAEEEETFAFETPFGSRRIVRKPGDLLHPSREPEETLKRIRETIGEYNFAGQYQQSPAPVGGGLVKRGWFKTYNPLNTPGFERIIQSWDTANKASELSDYSVCTTWGIKGKDAYLMNVIRRRMEYPELKRVVVNHAQAYLANVVLIEDKASGQQLVQELRLSGLQQVKPYAPEGDKVMRLHAQTAMIEGGFVYIPAQSHWLDEYLLELTTFPYAKHDDQANSTSQFLDWFQKASNRTGYRVFDAGWMER